MIAVQTLEITFEKGYEGTIYYSLDQNVPSTSSLKFDMPLKLGNGVHTIPLYTKINMVL